MKMSQLNLVKKYIIAPKKGLAGLSDHTVASDPLWFMTLQLMMEKDLNRNITSSLQTDKQGRKILIRDARALTAEDSSNDVSQWDYAILAVSYLKAYRKLCEMNGIEPELLIEGSAQYQMIMGAIDEIRVQNSEDNAIYAFKQAASMVITALARDLHINKAEAEKHLDNAKNWTSLERAPISVATLTKIDNQTLVQLDEPMYELTQAQIDDYNLCKKNANGKYSGPIWFLHLTNLEKDLVLAYKGQIIEGRVIPSQLRSSLPGIKNSYKQTTAVFNEADGEFDILNQNFHCATIVYLDAKRSSKDKAERRRAKDEMKRVAKLSMSQQLQHSKQANQDQQTHSVMITLNSEYGDDVLDKWEKLKGAFSSGPAKPFVGDDKPIVKQTRLAANSIEGASSANICLNHYRKIFKNDYSGNHEVLTYATNLLKSIYGSDYDPNRKSILGVDRFNQLLDDRLFDLLDILYKKINQCNKYIKKGTRLRLDSANVGLDIVRLSAEICHLNNKILAMLDEDYQDSKTPMRYLSQWFGCASGENRTGYGEFHIATTAIIDHLKANSSKDVDESEIRDVISRAGHVSRMTGFQGSTMGTEGIRKKSSGTAPSSYSKNTQKYLVSRPADAKKIKLVEAKSGKIDYTHKRMKYQKLFSSVNEHPRSVESKIITSKRKFTSQVRDRLQDIADSLPDQVLQHKHKGTDNEHYLLSSTKHTQEMKVYKNRVLSDPIYFPQMAELISDVTERPYVEISQWNNNIKALVKAATPLIMRGFVIDVVCKNPKLKQSALTLDDLIAHLDEGVAEQLLKNRLQHHAEFPEHLQLASKSTPST